MSTEERDKAIQLKSWEVTDAAWSAFDAEEYMTNGIQAAYDAGLRDARGQVTPDREAIARVIFNRNAENMGSAVRFENATLRMTQTAFEYADAILALFNEKGTP